MKKKILSLVVTLAMCLSLLPSTAFALSDFAIQNGKLTKYYGDGGDVVIPDNVTTIGSSVFYHCTGLTSLTIPDSVTTIETDAFSNCTGLTSVTIPSSITTMGNSVFAYCSNLTNVTISNGVTAIGDCAFAYCTNLTNVNIPNSVTTIRGGAFSYCRNLTSINIPSSVTSIGPGVFQGCTSLTSVTIPQGVTDIGMNAFYECTNLTSVTIPSSVTKIDNFTFGGCTGLTTLTIPSGVTTINYSAFWGCTNMTNLSIPSSITRMEQNVFYKCSSLADVYYGGSETQWNALKIDTGNDDLFRATVHYNSVGSSAAPTQPQQPVEPASPAVDGWAKDRVGVAVSNNLVPDGLGDDYRVNITRGQFAAVAVKLYEAMSGQAAPAAGGNPFSDTSDPVILQAAELGFISGLGDGRFGPDSLVTREQMAVMLSQVYIKLGGEIPAVTATAFADDSAIASWARSAVAFMNEAGILSGKDNNRFAPSGEGGGAKIEEALLVSLKMFEVLK